LICAIFWRSINLQLIPFKQFLNFSTPNPRIKMAAYLITGVSRGLGVSEIKLSPFHRKKDLNISEQFEFLRQISSNPANTVVGLVRDKTSTEKKVSEELPGRKNIHIVQADMSDFASLKKAVDDTAAITGGALDYVIANAALMSPWSNYRTFGSLYVDILLTNDNYGS
jgi:hypothetical protein